MHSRSSTAAVLLAAWLAASAGHAARAATVEVAASIANFQVQLTDLDPDDGIAPWVRFDWQPSPKVALYDDPFWTRLVAEHPTRNYEPVAITHGPNTVRGQVTRDAAMLEAALWDDSAFIDMERIASDSVSPNTGFVFTADATVSASAAPRLAGPLFRRSGWHADPVPRQRHQSRRPAARGHVRPGIGHRVGQRRQRCAGSDGRAVHGSARSGLRHTAGTRTGTCCHARGRSAAAGPPGAPPGPPAAG